MAQVNLQMYLIIDTETTGLPGKLSGEPTTWIYQNTARFAAFRAIQFAALLVDAEFNEVARWCYLLNTPVVCSAGALRVHKITDARRAVEGVSVGVVADMLATTLPQATHVIAHNALFDIELVAHEMYAAGRGEVLEMLHAKEYTCSMQIFGKKKLGVLYKAAFARDFDAHDALADCVALRELLARARPKICGNVVMTPGVVAPVAPTILPPLSDEQRAIVEAARAGRDIIVSAVAGSGKTTTALRIAEAIGGLGLILTYNRQLAHESEERARGAGIAAEIRTYHAFAVKYLARECFTDEGMIRALRAGDLTGTPEYSFVLFDECQDMTPVLYELARRIMRARACPLIIMGDPRQNIYRFRGADPKYMTAELWCADDAPRQFVELPLSVSYRLPVAVAAQVAEWSGVNIVGVRGGPAPIMMRGGSVFEARFIDTLCETWQANPSGMLVILPSVRKLGAAGSFQRICDALVARRVPVYVPKDDSEIPGEVQLRNKVGFITYHQSKGLERETVLVCVTEHFTRSWGGWQTWCPNEVYVALTRARSRLYVWSDFDIGEDLDAGAALSRKISVTDLCRHLLPQILVMLPQHVDFEVLAPAGEKLPGATPLTCMYGGREIVEDVSDIIGVMIPGIYSGFDPARKRTEINKYIARVGRQMPETLLSVPDICAAYLYYCVWADRQLHRASQISAFDWISDETVAAALHRMDECYRAREETAGLFEMPHVRDFMGVTITGRVDIDAPRHVWELKYVDAITDAHKLQCAIYSWMTGRPGLLFNIRTGELVHVVPRANFPVFMRAVICAKFHGGTIGRDFDAFEFCRGCNEDLAAM